MDEKNILLRFGRHVKSIRQQKNLSQEQLALVAGLDRTYISGIERGRRNVSLINLFKIANSLNIPTHEIIFFELSDKDDDK